MWRGLGWTDVVADVKPEAPRLSRALGFVPLERVREGRLHGAPTAMFLAIDTIAAALDG